MKTIFLLSVFGASLHASLAIVPVYGCEKYPQTAAVTNFTFTHGTTTTNTTGPSSVKWQAPALSVSCSASSSTNSIGAPGTYTSVPCGEKPSDPVTGSFQVSANGSNATITFTTYVQCAADIFGFRWEAIIPFLVRATRLGARLARRMGTLRPALLQRDISRTFVRHRRRRGLLVRHSRCRRELGGGYIKSKVGGTGG
jgi:hypothetical protein